MLVYLWHLFSALAFIWGPVFLLKLNIYVTNSHQKLVKAVSKKLKNHYSTSIQFIVLIPLKEVMCNVV